MCRQNESGMDIKIPDLSKQLGILGRVAAVVLAITALGGGYAFYRNNIWRPKVNVSNVDWNKQIADVLIGNKQKKLYGNSILSAGGKWGIRFGFTNGIATRLELVQDNLVYQILEVNKED